MGRNGVTRRRFSDFVDRFGFVLLSVCAHSKSFRILLDTDPLSLGSQTLWQDLRNLIESHAYSIELYARTRGLDWNPPLTESSRDGSYAWDQLICQSLYDVLDQHSHLRETEVLGVSDTEYNIRHELPDSVGHHHEWVVASGSSTAYNPTMTYRTGKGKTCRLVIERQVNIDASIILDDSDQFKWQNRPAWPTDDPRYRGPVSAPCEVCLDDSGKETVAPQRCDHTLAQMCRLHHSKTEKSSSRVELLQYPGKGVGVRALKAFRDREILAEYVGEIYPEHVIREGRKVSVELYPHPNGLSYRYEQPLEDLAVDDDQENKKKTPSPNRQCRTMIIDPSIRGNWPRYMNHSCRPATLFEYRFVGDKQLTLIVADRNIHFDEEITVDYGLDYWQAADYGCACGEDQCTLWDPVQNKVKGGTKVTWEQEKARRAAGPESEPEPEVAEQVKKKPKRKVRKKPVVQGKKEQKTEAFGAKTAVARRRKAQTRTRGHPQREQGKVFGRRRIGIGEA